MTGDKERGDAAADKWRDTFEKSRRETDNALTRLDVRADMKSMGEDEISEVIDQRALEAQQAKGSLPERAAGGIRTVLDGINSWQKVAALFLLCAVAAFAAWLRWR